MEAKKLTDYEFENMKLADARRGITRDERLKVFAHADSLAAENARLREELAEKDRQHDAETCAHIEGFKARDEGKSLSENPHDMDGNSEGRTAVTISWACGWMERQQQMRTEELESQVAALLDAEQRARGGFDNWGIRDNTHNAAAALEVMSGVPMLPIAVAAVGENANRHRLSALPVTQLTPEHYARMRERIHNTGVLGLDNDEARALFARLDEVEPKLIPASKRLPEPGVSCLLLMRGGRFVVGHFVPIGVWNSPAFHRSRMMGDISHWMPLPEPPVVAAVEAENVELRAGGVKVEGSVK